MHANASPHIRRWIPHALFASVLALVALAYLPGLHGPFLFDDFANLPALGAGGPVDNMGTFLRYVTSSNADPTGRPVAMASFLVDARDWPADPFAFKRTNLLIHLFNGTLLYFLLRRLSPPATPHDSAQRWRYVALLAAACWIAHPLLVSTTLYIVQREAMLPATFVMLGIHGWLSGRQRISLGKTKQGIVSCVLSLIAATALATLSKANGVLLPVLLLVLETTVLAAWHNLPSDLSHRAHRNLLRATLWPASIILVVGLLGLGVKGIALGIGTLRPWTLAERLLTEPRIVWEYLRLLWLPKPFTSGVFNDQEIVSHGLFTPWTTLPSILALALLTVTAVRLRARLPLVSAAVLFFLVGHLLESTTVPLELYFEHRNYLPAMLMFWPLAALIVAPRRTVDAADAALVRRRDGARAIAAVALVGLLCAMTRANADVWGNTSDQAQLWAALNPDSPRAQVYAAQDDINRGRPERAIARLDPLLQQYPTQIQLSLNLLAAECESGSVSARTLEQARRSLRQTRDPGALLVSWFERARDRAAANACAGLDLQALASLAAEGSHNPNFQQGRRQDLEHIEGILALSLGRPAQSKEAFDRALAEDPRPGIALEQAAILGSAGFPEAGLSHLRYYDRIAHEAQDPWGMPGIHDWILRRQQYWQNERAHLEHTLERDAGTTPATHDSP